MPNSSHKNPWYSFTRGELLQASKLQGTCFKIRNNKYTLVDTASNKILKVFDNKCAEPLFRFMNEFGIPNEELIKDTELLEAIRKKVKEILIPAVDYSNALDEMYGFKKNDLRERTDEEIIHILKGLKFRFGQGQGEEDIIIVPDRSNYVELHGLQEVCSFVRTWRIMPRYTFKTKEETLQHKKNVLALRIWSTKSNLPTFDWNKFRINRRQPTSDNRNNTTSSVETDLIDVPSTVHTDLPSTLRHCSKPPYSRFVRHCSKPYSKRTGSGSKNYDNFRDVLFSSKVTPSTNNSIPTKRGEGPSKISEEVLEYVPSATSVSGRSIQFTNNDCNDDDDDDNFEGDEDESAPVEQKLLSDYCVQSYPGALRDIQHMTSEEKDANLNDDEEEKDICKAADVVEKSIKDHIDQSFTSAASVVAKNIQSLSSHGDTDGADDEEQDDRKPAAKVDTDQSYSCQISKGSSILPRMPYFVIDLSNDEEHTSRKKRQKTTSCMPLRNVPAERQHGSTHNAANVAASKSSSQGTRLDPINIIDDSAAVVTSAYESHKRALSALKRNLQVIKGLRFSNGLVETLAKCIDSSTEKINEVNEKLSRKIIPDLRSHEAEIERQEQEIRAL